MRLIVVDGSSAARRRQRCDDEVQRRLIIKEVSRRGRTSKRQHMYAKIGKICGRKQRPYQSHTKMSRDNETYVKTSEP